VTAEPGPPGGLAEPGPPGGLAEQGPPGGLTSAFDPGLAYEKHPQVAIRTEEFGGLAYHYGNRRLVFLKAPELVTLVESLARYPAARDALAACVPEPRRGPCERALSSLLASGIIRPAAGRG
jgi:mycofactocin biosynthesis protein MftB